jgi:hypothetical protein
MDILGKVSLPDTSGSELKLKNNGILAVNEMRRYKIENP